MQKQWDKFEKYGTFFNRSFGLVSARLQYLLCVSNGDTTVFLLAIDFKTEEMHEVYSSVIIKCPPPFKFKKKKCKKSMDYHAISKRKTILCRKSKFFKNMSCNSHFNQVNSIKLNVIFSWSTKLCINLFTDEYVLQVIGIWPWFSLG